MHAVKRYWLHGTSWLQESVSAISLLGLSDVILMTVFDRNNQWSNIHVQARTFDDELDDVRRLSDDVCERTRVGTTVSPLQPAQLNPVTVDSDAVVAGRHQLSSVLAPSQWRSWRCRRLTEHVDRVTFLLNQESWWHFTQHWRSCNRHTCKHAFIGY